MILAAEDAALEAIGLRILAVYRPDIAVPRSIGLRGKSDLRKRARELNRAATTLQVMMLVDLDDPAGCPALETQEWLGGKPNPGLLLRFAVIESEAWLLADRSGLADYLKIPVGRVPTEVESVPDPKRALVNLARQSGSRTIREELVPSTGATSPVGPAYNSSLRAFIAEAWDPERARAKCESLERTIRRVMRL